MSDLTCFKAYDIRGEIGVNIDAGIAYRIGRAVAQNFGAKAVVIGFDARETSPAFAAAAARTACPTSPICWVGSGFECSGSARLWELWRVF